MHCSQGLPNVVFLIICSFKILPNSNCGILLGQSSALLAAQKLLANIMRPHATPMPGQGQTCSQDASKLEGPTFRLLLP